MKYGSAPSIRRDKAICLAAALLLHGIVLTVPWRPHSISRPTKTVTVFVSLISPATPARVEPPVAQKSIPTLSQQLPAARPVTPVAPTPMPMPTALPRSATPMAHQAETVPQATAVKVPAPAVPAAVAQPSAPSVNAALPTAPPMPVTLGSELSLNCSERTPPAYPKQSMRLGEQGKTVLQVELDESGRVAAVAVKSSSGFQRLDDAAISAVNSWHCTPARRNGIAVRATALQPFNFALKGR